MDEKPKTLSELIGSRAKPTKKPPRSEREMLLEMFLPILNSSRAVVKLPLLTPVALSAILKYYGTTELYGLQKECSNAKSFTRMFWFLVKQKKHGRKKETSREKAKE